MHTYSVDRKKKPVNSFAWERSTRKKNQNTTGTIYVHVLHNSMHLKTQLWSAGGIYAFTV